MERERLCHQFAVRHLRCAGVLVAAFTVRLLPEHTLRSLVVAATLCAPSLRFLSTHFERLGQAVPNRVAST
jgi:hypothetical protein